MSRFSLNFSVLYHLTEYNSPTDRYVLELITIAMFRIRLIGLVKKLMMVYGKKTPPWSSFSQSDVFYACCSIIIRMVWLYGKMRFLFSTSKKYTLGKAAREKMT